MSRSRNADEAAALTAHSKGVVSQVPMADEAPSSGASLLRQIRRQAMGPVGHVPPGKQAAAFAARLHGEDDNTRGVS